MTRISHWAGLIDIELTKAICNRQCILFVGSGLSAGIPRQDGRNLPTWRGLLEELLDYAKHNVTGGVPNDRDIDKLLHDNKLLVAAQELRAILEGDPSKPHLSIFMRSVFDPVNLNPPSDAHAAIASNSNLRGILTTNYDTLIEEAFRTNLNAFVTNPSVIQMDEVGKHRLPLRPNDDFFIFKAHGQFDRDIVLGTQDYQTAIFNLPGYRQFLETLFSVYTVLFVGFGGNDPNLESILDRVASLYSRQFDTHFILMPKWEMTNDTERRRLEEDRRVRVIEFDDYAQVEEFLYAIQKPNLNCAPIRPYKNIANNKLKIFISYSRHDADLASKITQLLVEQGHAVFYAEDYFSFVAGESLSQAISEAIGNADCVIVIVTGNALESTWVKNEARYALYWSRERDTHLLPLRVDQIEIPNYLANVNSLNIDSNLSALSQAVLVRRIDDIVRQRDMYGIRTDIDTTSQQFNDLSDEMVYESREDLIQRVVNLMQRFDGQSVPGSLFNQGGTIWLPDFSNISVEQITHRRRVDILTRQPRWVVEVWSRFHALSEIEREEYAIQLREDASAEFVWLIVGKAYISLSRRRFLDRNILLSTALDIHDLEIILSTDTS